MTQKLLRLFLPACLALGCASFAQADLIIAPTFDGSNQAQPPDTTDYEGIYYDYATTDPLAPTNPITVGTFTFDIPADETVLGATISGTFGDLNEPGTAPVDLFVNDGSIGVAQCDVTGTVDNPAVPGCALGDSGPAAWSYTFSSSDLTNLATEFAAGSLDFSAVMNAPTAPGTVSLDLPGAVIVGTPTLDLQLSPEPGSVFMLAGGLLTLVAVRRRK